MDSMCPCSAWVARICDEFWFQTFFEVNIKVMKQFGSVPQSRYSCGCQDGRQQYATEDKSLEAKDGKGIFGDNNHASGEAQRKHLLSFVEVEMVGLAVGEKHSRVAEIRISASFKAVAVV